MAPPPIFTGRNLDGYPVTQFLADIELYFATANPDIDRKIIIFDAAIQQPAKRKFDAKRTLDQFGVRPRIDADRANDAAREAYFVLQFNARAAWLENEYNGIEQQRLMRSKLFGMQQRPGESPKSFFDRIEEQITRAGLANEQHELTLENIFINGLHKPISDHARSLALANLDGILNATHNYWSVKGYQEEEPQFRQQPRSRLARRPRELYEEEPPRYNPRILQRSTPFPQEEPQPRYTMAAQQMPIYQDEIQRNDPIMDDLEACFQGLKASVVRLEKKAERNYQPMPRSFSNQRNEMDP